VFLCVVFAVPVPVGLAREFTTVGLENDSVLSHDSVGSNSQQDDAVSLNHGHTNELFDGEISAVNPSHTNSDIRVFEMSDNSDLVACQLKSNADSTSPEASPTDAVAAYGERLLPEDTDSPKDISVSSPQASNSNQENSLSWEDSETVDIVELGSALWPKRMLTVHHDVDCSFDTLVADHADYCKENTTEDSTRQEIIRHGCCGRIDSVHDHQEALWPVVLKWLKQSDDQFRRQMPRCSALVDGLLASDSNITSEKRTTADSDRKVSDLTPVSTGTNTTTVSTVSSQTNSIAIDLSNARRFGTESEGYTNSSSPPFLSRSQMLSLQFSGVPLSAEVIARVSELKLRRADGIVQAPTGKPRHSQWSERVKPNSVGKTWIQSALEMTESKTHSVSTENSNNEQLTNQSAVKRDDDVLLNVDITAGSVETNTKLTSNLESVNCTDVASGKTETNGTQQLKTSQSDEVPTVLYFHPASDTSADPSAGNATFGNKSPMCYPNSSVQTSHEGPQKSLGIGAGSVNSSVELPSVGGSTAMSDMCAVTHSKATHSARKSDLSTHAASMADGGKPRSKKVKDSSETMVNRKYHKDVASSQERHRVSRAKHGVVTGDACGEMDDERITKERHHRSKKGHQYSTASVAGASDPESRPRSRHWKCSRCQNVKHKTYYDPLHDWCSNQQYSPSYAFDHYGGYSPYCMPNVMTQSVLASVSYSSYCLGAYDAHMHSMHYYNMLSQRDTGTADLWQQQADYIRQMTKLCAHS